MLQVCGKVRLWHPIVEETFLTVPVASGSVSYNANAEPMTVSIVEYFSNWTEKL